MTAVVEEVGNIGFGSREPSILKAATIFRSWRFAHGESGLQAEKLTKSIQSLQPGDSTALYIRAQNAGLILTVPEPGGTREHDPDSVILSVFAPSQPSETVMAADGPMCAGFPGLSYHLPRSTLLESYSLADQLVSLSKNLECMTMPVSNKAGNEHVEIREVSDPFFISQWLPASLSIKTSDLCHHYKPVSKKIRDQIIIGSSTLPFRRSGLWMTAKVVLHLTLRNGGVGEFQANILYKLIMLKLMLNCAVAWTKDLEAEEGMEVMAKIVRRLLKLRKYIDANPDSVTTKVGISYIISCFKY
jgi:hypothetical protein